MRRLLPLLFLLVGACAPAAVEGPSVRVEAGDFVVQIRGEGFLQSTESIPIALPTGQNFPLMLAWIVPDGTRVEAGDPVARFEGRAYARNAASAAFELARLALERRLSEGQLALEQSDIAAGLTEIGLERGLIERFPLLDERLYARNEIIDKLADLAWLDARERFLRFRDAFRGERAEGELALLEARRRAQENTLRINREALEHMELRAPIAGEVVRERNFWGEPLEPGQPVFPGFAVARIPVPGKLEARIFVPESEAQGLAAGQPVRLRLDAAPERTYRGTVASVDAVASPRERQNPVKYFGLRVALETVDGERMRVGQRLSAEILVAERRGVLTLPLLAVEETPEGAFVRLANRSGERRRIELGARSPTRVEILAGLAAGDRVLLRGDGSAR
jgi:multidrug efflux pump subunit AcrA (membrane-fusion protein)